MKNNHIQRTNYLLHPFIKSMQPIFAFFILPFINAITLCLANPINENISYITNTLHYRFIGILWVISCSLYLYVYTARFAYALHYKHQMGLWYLRLSTFAMFISVIIPYVPEVFPFLAKIHINLSMIATISYVLVMFHILLSSYFHEPLQVTRLFSYYITIVGSCLLLFLLMGCVSTLLEVLFVVSMGFFLYKCNRTFEI